MTSPRIHELVQALDEQLPRPRDKFAIVFYHVDMEPGPSNPLQRFRGGRENDYAKDIAISIPAARKIHPEASVIMLTDNQTNIEEHEGLSIVRLPCGRELGMERTRCQIAFSNVWGGPALHLDTDMEIRKSANFVLDQAFDFALSWRPDFLGQRINGGWFAVKNPKCFAAFQTAVLEMIPHIADVYHRPDLRTAFGEQMALDMLWANMRQHWQASWGRVATFRCADVNYTYSDDDDSDQARDALIWHRKGANKAGLKAAAE